jgi:hypothetical protein
MCRWLFCVLAVMAMGWGIPSSAGAAFEIVAHSIEQDEAARETRFSLTFNQPPDFFDVDEFDRPANSFQYWYDAQPGGFEFAGEDVVVIRGPEIRFNGELPVRESLNESGEEFPGAEGWGEPRGMVPIDMEGSTLEFIVPWDVLGEKDKAFSYRLLAFEFGEQTSDVSAIFVELPTSLEVGTIALLLTSVGLGMRRQWAR